MNVLQILGGYVFDAFLTPWTLLIKALGLALAVASGLSLGKEVSDFNRHASFLYLISTSGSPRPCGLLHVAHLFPNVQGIQNQ